VATGSIPCQDATLHQTQGIAERRIPFSSRLRRADAPDIGRITRGGFLLDVRTVMDDDLSLVATALEGLAAGQVGFSLV